MIQIQIQIQMTGVRVMENVGVRVAMGWNGAAGEGVPQWMRL
jgi:hypothetical protein